MDGWVIAVAAAGGILAARAWIGGRRVSSDVVKQKLEAGATVLDVRTPQEFRGGAYPGARNIPVQELGARAVVLRPDRYLVGAASSAAELDALTADARRWLAGDLAATTS